MRRPGPIPASGPPAQEPASFTEKPSNERHSRASRFLLPQRSDSVSAAAATPDDSETVPIAPLFGTWGLSEGETASADGEEFDPRLTTGSHSEVVEGAVADAAGPISYGSRDVWRAARARRKMLRAEIRRFTQRTRRRRLVLVGSIGAVLVVVLGSLAAAYSPLFSVEKITVLGAQTLDSTLVVEALASQQGVPLALVDSSAVKAALLAFPLIESYTLEAHPPHDLTVRIVERTPVGVIESDAGFTLVDAAGVALSTTPDRPAGSALIGVDGGLGSPAFVAAGRVMRTLPEAIRAQVDRVEAASPNDVTLLLQSGARIVWGSADKSADKALVLEKVMASKPDASMYDVSSPEAVVLG